MKTLHPGIEIDAPAERVWGIPADLAAYPAWNPFIRRITGGLKPGARLEVRPVPPGGMGVTLRPVVQVADAGRELRWLGALGVRGRFDGEHRLALEPLGDVRGAPGVLWGGAERVFSPGRISVGAGLVWERHRLHSLPGR